jgi:hypothetical protein
MGGARSGLAGWYQLRASGNGAGASGGTLADEAAGPGVEGLLDERTGWPRVGTRAWAGGGVVDELEEVVEVVLKVLVVEGTGEGMRSLSNAKTGVGEPSTSGRVDTVRMRS